MSGMACSLCMRDECDRCHDGQCACCGAGELLFPQLARDEYDWDYDEYDEGPVTL